MRPFFGAAASGEQDEPEQRGGGGEQDGENEGLQGAFETEPCTQQGHELGVTEAHAFATTDQPVGEADEEDNSGGESGFENPGPQIRKPGVVVHAVQQGLGYGESQAEGDAREGEPVGEPKVFGIEGGEGGQQTGEQGVAEEDDEDEGFRGWTGGKERWGKVYPASGPQ